MKKQLCILLCVVGLFGCACRVAAEKSAGIAVDSAQASPGDTFTVTLTVPEYHQKISDASFKFSFSPAAFQMTSCQVPQVDGADKTHTDTESANQAGCFAVGYCSSSFEADVSWNALEITCTFQVTADAAPQDYTFTVTEYALGALTDEGLPQAVADMPADLIKTVTVTVAAARESNESAIGTEKNSASTIRDEKKTVSAIQNGENTEAEIQDGENTESADVSVGEVTASAAEDAVSPNGTTAADTPAGEKDDESADTTSAVPAAAGAAKFPAALAGLLGIAVVAAVGICGLAYRKKHGKADNNDD